MYHCSEEMTSGRGISTSEGIFFYMTRSKVERRNQVDVQRPTMRSGPPMTSQCLPMVPGLSVTRKLGFDVADLSPSFENYSLGDHRPSGLFNNHRKP